LHSERSRLRRAESPRGRISLNPAAEIPWTTGARNTYGCRLFRRFATGLPAARTTAGIRRDRQVKAAVLPTPTPAPSARKRSGRLGEDEPRSSGRPDDEPGAGGCRDQAGE